MRVDSDGLADFTGDALLVLEITRAEVESGNIASALDRLLVVAESRETALRYQESMALYVTGYDQDPRELPEIPEVRAFFARLCEEWPHWLWFLQRNIGAIPLLLALICSVKVHRFGTTTATEFLDREELSRKVMDLMQRGNAMFLVFGITPEQARASARSACLEIANP